MDRSKREHLKEKRTLLKKEIHFKEMRNRIAPVLHYLEEQHFPFTIHYDFKYVNWIHQQVKVRSKDGYRGSHGDFQVDVNDATVITTKITSEDDFVTVKPMIAFFNEISNDTTLILCSLTGDPELEISKEAFLSKPSMFFSNPETWVLSRDRKYIIERIWSQDIIRCIDITQSEPILKVKSIIDS